MIVDVCTEPMRRRETERSSLFNALLCPLPFLSEQGCFDYIFLLLPSHQTRQDRQPKRRQADNHHYYSFVCSIRKQQMSGKVQTLNMSEYWWAVCPSSTSFCFEMSLLCYCSECQATCKKTIVRQMLLDSNLISTDDLKDSTDMRSPEYEVCREQMCARMGRRRCENKWNR